MSTTAVSPESLLKLVAASSPAAWHPKAYSQTSGVSREQLDAPLNDLRLAGLIQLTEWIKDAGQGYVLTPFGREVLANPQYLARLRDGQRPDSKATEDRPRDDHHERRDGGRPTALERGDAVRNALLYPQPPKVTWTLIAVNALVFLVGFAISRQGIFLEGRDSDILRKMGALKGEFLVNGEWWRVLACCFLHAGVFHLGMNMYSLFASGNKLESLWGRWPYLVLYFLSGIGGATIAVIFEPTKLLAGASGAIWGLMMSPLVWVWLNRRFLPAPMVKEWLSQWWMIVLCNVLISFLPGISMAAHFGGGLVGLVVSVLLHYSRNGSDTLRQVCTAMLLLIPFVCYGALYSAIENDPRFQRIGRVVQGNQQREAKQEYRQQVKPLMDALNQQVKIIDDQAMILINRSQEKREPEELKAVRAKIDNRAPDLRELLLLHPEKNVPEATKALVASGRTHLMATQELLEGFEKQLDLPIPEGDTAKELRQLRDAARKAKENWEGLVR